MYMYVWTHVHVCIDPRTCTCAYFMTSSFMHSFVFSEKYARAQVILWKALHTKKQMVVVMLQPVM